MNPPFRHTRFNFSSVRLFSGLTMTADDKLLYFAYGSNLMAERIHLNNPSAVRVAPGKLKVRGRSLGPWKKPVR